MNANVRSSISGSPRRVLWYVNKDVCTIMYRYSYEEISISSMLCYVMTIALDSVTLTSTGPHQLRETCQNYDVCIQAAA